MSRSLADRVADTVLYEGYILYPYRPSIKNRQRWTFGGLYPQAFCRNPAGADTWHNQTECLVHGSADTSIAATVRFLHLTARQVGQIDPPLPKWRVGVEPTYRPVETLAVGERLYQTWQEAEERTIALPPLTIAAMQDRPHREAFDFPGRRWLEPIQHDGQIVGVLVREQQALTGAVDVSAAAVASNLFKVKLHIQNCTTLDADHSSRDDALLRTLNSTHAILRTCAGEFVSLLEPPEPWQEHAAACQNAGTWPVLVGDDGQKDTILSSPIILYDYPQLAPESPGDLFDGTEIDEILTLRILTMTDDEKRQMSCVDERARAMLVRTEALDNEQLMRLHGTVRGMRTASEGNAHG